MITVSRMHTAIVPLCICLAAGLTAPLFAQGLESAAPVVADISVSGLTRTRPAVARRLLEGFIGRDVASIREDEVAAVLLDTGIFEEIELRFEERPEGALMAVSLREKWSIIPLPIFAAGSDGVVAGAALIDANAFGLNDKLFAVGLALPGGWMGSVAYVKTPPRDRALGWTVSGFFSRQDREDLDARGDALRRYGYDAAALGLELNAPLARALRGELGMEYRSRAIREISDALAQPEDTASLGLRLGFGIRAPVSWDGTFLSEKSASVGYIQNFALDGPDFGALYLRFKYESAPFPGLKLGLRGAGVLAPDSPPTAETGADMVRLGILPGAYAARSIAALAAGLEFKLVSLGAATFAGLADYQLGLSEGPLIGERLDHGPSAGLRLYLARVAIPAMDLSLAYNAVSGLMRLNFGIGMRM